MLSSFIQYYFAAFSKGVSLKQFSLFLSYSFSNQIDHRVLVLCSFALRKGKSGITSPF
jgi:hypothetical protein